MESQDQTPNQRAVLCFNGRNYKGACQRMWRIKTINSIYKWSPPYLIDACMWYGLEAYVARDRSSHLLHHHPHYPDNLLCSQDIKHAKFLDIQQFKFACCFVCWLLCFCFVLFFGFYTSCKPLIVFEMSVNLFHCTFHCNMPDDTKK